MVTPTNHVIIRGPWHFEDFRKILLPNIDEDQKKSNHLSAGTLALCHMANPTRFIALRSQKREMKA